MNDKIKIELDKYEVGIILNALCEYRNKSIEANISTDAIDELFIRFSKIYDKVCPLIKAMKKDYAR